MSTISPILPVAASLQPEGAAADSAARKLNIRVLRFDPRQPEVAPHWQTYVLDDAAGMTLFIALTEIREGPTGARFDRHFTFTDASGKVLVRARTTWAMVEAGGCPVELTYELETVARNDFFGTLPGAFSAHPKLDPATGELHAMTYAWGQWIDHAQYVVVGPDGRVSKTVDIPMGMTMLHDMSITPTYAVIYDQPCTVDLDLAFGGSRFPFRWNPSYGNRVGLLPLDGGTADDVVWIEVPVGYAFHPMNAYDTPEGRVVIDLCNYDRMFDRHVHGPFGDGLPRLERWELDPVAQTATITVLDDRPNEFPRHRGSLSTQPYRYGYTVRPATDHTSAWTTVKHDLETAAVAEFDHGEGRAAGEAVFVAREGSTAEDDGWLLTFVHDLGRDAAEFVVMDAQDLDRGYVASVRLPQRIPFGFHGNWVGDASVPPPA